jgi:hypothetical protein
VTSACRINPVRMLGRPLIRLFPTMRASVYDSSTEKRMPHQYPQRSRCDAPRTVLLCLALVLTCACAACVASRPPLQGSTPRAEPTVPTVRVFIVVHRWHSGVVLPRAALPRAILPEVVDFPDASLLESVMLFGHNPELTELAHRLSSEITHMPTCAVAEFTFNAKSWSNIGKARVAKVALDYPKKS